MERKLTFTVRVAVLVIASTSIFAVGFVDSRTPDISFSIFYVIPILVVAWYGNRILALVAATTCALTGLAADTWSASAEPIYRLVNFGARLALFTIVALAFSRLRTALGKERELARRQLLLAEKERELRALQDELVRSVIEGTREPLGEIYARVVDLSFEGEGMTQEDARQLLRELAEASLKVSRLVGSLEVREEFDPALGSR